jgi:hypothetical protein
MNLDLSDEEAAALTADITGNDRFRFSESIRALKAILAKLRLEPVSGAHRLVPVTTISTCRPPHLEQTNFSRQSSKGVSAPYRVVISAGSGSA